MGGDITSDGGGLLLREVELRTGILKGFAACFTDYRDPESIEHSVFDLVAQRSYGLCMGYEDLNDHDQLRSDLAFAVMVGKEDLKGEKRRKESDHGKALAGKSTLNRLELTAADAGASERYKKIVMNPESVDRLLDHFIEANPQQPEQIILDLDVTDDLIHGTQEGRFFHGYYGNYCYLPLYIFCGEFLLCARLRSADGDAADGALDELKRIIKQIRQSWPKVHILVRADSGFCRDEILTWCERNGVDYVIGFAKNDRLLAEIREELEKAKQEFEKAGKPARIFKDVYYRTRESWSCRRRVIAKAEHLEKGTNPRFIVTSLPKHGFQAAPVYEVLYCGRGEMENRIKEQQLGLFADRTSTATMRGAIRFVSTFRPWPTCSCTRCVESVWRGTELAQAQCTTIRLKLLKIGAQIHISVRRVWFRMAGGYPYSDVFATVLAKLHRLPLVC